ncbi:hypothetical protein [Thermoactinospora rubra]|uniref:hypothetical protein n=1 Tax=Thermoactinospora rubra TaxID=1088767 RepID=UPI001F0A3F16|nr:hypothetical protein [Thermoactinospora rubra]
MKRLALAGLSVVMMAVTACGGNAAAPSEARATGGGSPGCADAEGKTVGFSQPLADPNFHVLEQIVTKVRFVHNDRLVDALHLQASCAILHVPAVRAYYDQLKARDVSHNAALRQVGNRLVGILHGCLKTHTRYDQAIAWSHRNHDLTA